MLSVPKWLFRLCLVVTGTLFIFSGSGYTQNTGRILTNSLLNKYVLSFNSADSESVINYIPDSKAARWLSENIPLFECPDTLIQKIYYYRWWSFRKHLKETPDGFIFTEFLTPVKHAGRYNSISCALGHHIYEGRWLRDPLYVEQYLDFWIFRDKTFPAPRFHAFSSWVDDAVYNLYLVKRDNTLILKLLPALDADYTVWESEKQLPDGMFWQYDVKDGMEESVSGGRKVKNLRPSINSYMFGNAEALAKMAALVKVDSLEYKYRQKAQKLKSQVQGRLWNGGSSFFETLTEEGKLAPREAIGFIPWYFNLPDDTRSFSKAWDQLTDTLGFCAPWGITTAERREPTFRTRGTGHSCEWDGAIWPFASTQTLKGLANLLCNYKNHGKMNAGDFYNELYKYAYSHQKNGKVYLGEYQDEKTGYWLKGDDPRSSFYNHSGFCDLVINDLVGIKPRPDNILEIHPLIPKNKWDWFCLDNISYHGKNVSVLWDKTGKKYGKGKGMRIYVDGTQIAHSRKLKPIRSIVH